ncbi:MAG: O-antigen ligase family protein [Candidatus Omnitrophica bacterium]|nr:O-antigen ligase family protein [Candidatus Omnitrophota bacterium]
MQKTNPTIHFMKAACTVFLFAWVSFFAPLVGGPWPNRFIGLLFVLLLVLLWLGRDSLRLTFEKSDLFLLLFVFLMIPGIMNVKDSLTAYSQFQYFIVPIPFLYFFAKAAYPDKYILPVLRAVCFMAAVVSVVGFVEFITGRNFIYEHFVDNFAYLAFRGRRAMSLHIHPAPLGTYLAAILPVSVALVIKENNNALKTLSVLYLAAIVNCILLTASRGAFAGVLAGAMIMTIFLAKRNRFAIVLLLMAMLASIVWINSALSEPGYSFDPFYRFGIHGLAEYPYARKFIRILAIGDILKDHPFFGLGLGHYRIFFDHYVPELAKQTDPLSKIADCIYATILAETGIVGFSAFLLMIGALFRRIWLKLRILQNSENRLYLTCFAAGLAGIMVSFLTYDGLFWVAPSFMFWSYCGIVSALSKPGREATVSLIK